MYLEFTMDEFHQHKGNWLLYRAMGEINANGSFVPPLSYFEAQQMPKRTMQLFMIFDDYADRMLRTINKKKGTVKNG